MPGPPAQVQQQVQIDALRCQSAQPVDDLIQVPDLSGGHESQMAAADVHAVIVWKIADHPHWQCALNLRLYHLIQPFGTAVQDHAADRIVPVGQHSLNERNHGVGHALCVYNQDGRGLGGGGDGVGAFFTAHADAVVVTHDALHHGKIRRAAVLRHQLPQLDLRGKKRVQIAAGPPRDMAVQHGIDVVRTAFIRLYLDSPVTKRL